MRKVTLMIIFILLLLSTFAHAALSISGLWTPTKFSWTLPGKYGPGVIVKNGGNLLVLAKDGSVYELQMSGTLVPLGQVSGIQNVVTPPTYVEVNSTAKYLIWVTAQNTAANTVNIINVANTSSTPLQKNINGASYGVVAYKGGTKIYIITATMNGVLYKFEYDGANWTGEDSNTIAGPVKVPPIISPSKDTLYILTQNGKFYSVNNSGPTLGSPTLKLTLGGEFTTPMAMDEGGFIYALSSTGVLYKIDPSGSEQHVQFLSSCNSSGPLIDGEGIIYIFGNNGKIVALTKTLVKIGEYTIDQQITTTPAIVKGKDGLTYLIVPSSSTNGTGKITILSFVPATGTFSKVWEYTTTSTFPISAAVGVAPLGALYNDNYYFATATNDGTIYAWQFDARGPYGVWAMYGQNINHTGFVDSSSMAFRTRIFIIAKEGYYGKELSSTLLNSTTAYGLLYDAKKYDSTNQVVGQYSNLRTNETNLANIPEGIPGSEKLEVKFATSTSSLLLFTNNFQVQGGSKPTVDSTFTFRFWKTGQSGYEGSEGDNPATLTYMFNDRYLTVFTDAIYMFYIYHKYPLQSNSESTETTDAVFDFNQYRSNPNTAVKTVNSKTNYQSQKWYAYKWNVYQWNPDNPLGYDKTTYYQKDSVSLPIKGPAYIEIYYAQLSATVTLLVPEFALGRTRAYLFLDAAANSIAYNIDLKTLNGVTIESIQSEEFANNVSKINSLCTVNGTQLKYVLDSMQNPLSADTRVATIILNLNFPQKAQFSAINDMYFTQYFNLTGYAQVQGQLVDPANLQAKRVFKTNRFLYVVGDFNGDFVVDINDWNLFVNVLGTTVSGPAVIYNIGPREDFNPPYPSYTNYKAGYLTDASSIVNENDFYYFATMFGFAVPESERVK
ncbi:MAG: hypothetical protein ACP5KD_00765 [Fervidobacterium sp.]